MLCLFIDVELLINVLERGNTGGPTEYIEDPICLKLKDNLIGYQWQEQDHEADLGRTFRLFEESSEVQGEQHHRLTENQKSEKDHQLVLEIKVKFYLISELIDEGSGRAEPC